MKVVIKSLSETDDETGETLYWSNEDGWVKFEGADVFYNDFGLWYLPDNSELEYYD